MCLCSGWRAGGGSPEVLDDLRHKSSHNEDLWEPQDLLQGSLQTFSKCGTFIQQMVMGIDNHSFTMAERKCILCACNNTTRNRFAASYVYLKNLIVLHYVL